MTKDCVYIAKCKVCDQCYCGETKNLQRRSGDHNNDFKRFGLLSQEEQEKSALAKHFHDSHPDHALKGNVIFDVLHKTNGYLDRKFTEAVVCKYQINDFDINRRIEGAGCIDGHFS